MFFKTGDIVINKKRSIIFIFEMENEQHRKEIFQCRAATFDERKRFALLGVKKASIKDINLSKKESIAPKISITLEIPANYIASLNRVGDSNGLIKYEDVVIHILTKYNLDFEQKAQNLLELQMDDQKVLKQIKSLLDSIIR